VKGQRTGEAFPVAEYITDELNAHGWTWDDFVRLAEWDERRRDGAKIGALFTVSMAEDCARIFKGTNVMTWLRLHRAYRDWRAREMVR